MKSEIAAALLCLCAVIAPAAQNSTGPKPGAHAELTPEVLKISIVRECGSPITALAVSPNGKYILSGNENGVTRLWTPDGELIKTVSETKEKVRYLGFMPNSRSFLTDKMKIMELDGTQTDDLLIRADKTALSPDGKTIAYTRAESLYMQAIPDGMPQLLGTFTQPVKYFSFSADSRFLAASIGDTACNHLALQTKQTDGACKNSARIWSLPDGKQTALFEEPRNEIMALALSPDGKRLAYSYLYGIIKFCDTDSGKCRTTRLRSNSIYVLEWSPDGTTLAGSGSASKVMLWNSDGEYKTSLAFPAIGADQSAPTANVLAWSPDSATLYAGLHPYRNGTEDVIIAINRDGTQTNSFGTVSKNAIISAAFTPDGNNLLLSTRDRHLYHWNRYFALENTVSAGADITGISPSPNGSAIIYRAGATGLRISGKNGKELGNYTAHSTHLAINEDASLIAEAGKNHSLTVRKRNGARLAEYTLPGGIAIDCKGKELSVEKDGFATDIAFSHGGKNVAWISDDGNSLLIAPAARSKATHPVSVPQQAKILVWSGDGKRIITGGKNGWQMFSPAGKKLADKTSAYAEITALAASRDGRFFACGYETGQVELYASDGKLHETFSGHDRRINTLAFSPNGRYMLSGSEDATARLWNIVTGDDAIFFSSGTAGIVFTRDGYFDATAEGGDLVRLTHNIYSHEVDQFALDRNRPDVILRRMGWGSAEAIEAFRTQHQKQLQRANRGKEQSAAKTPFIFSAIRSMQQDENKLKLFVECDAPNYTPVREYNIYANGVLIKHEKAPDKKDLVGFGKPETVALTPGINRIEFSCIDEKGLESYRAVNYVRYDSAARSALYYIGFGVSKYKDSSLNLDFAAKDAADLGATLAKATATFSSVHIKTYLDGEVTRQAIGNAKDFLKDAKPEDTFVLFIAGHGIHNSDKDATYYYLTHDTDRNNIAATAADFSIIENLLQGITPRRKLLLMDTCESGEMAPEEETTLLAKAETAGLRSRGMKRFGTRKTAPKKPAQPRPWLMARDRYLYQDFSRRSGAIVFSSSRGGEPSFEDSRLNNGIFTGQIKRALSGEADSDHDGMVSTDELREFVSAAVAANTMEAQHPVVDRDNIHQKFSFPIIK